MGSKFPNLYDPYIHTTVHTTVLYDNFGMLLMIARRLHLCKMDLKFAVLRKILLIIMASFYKKVRSSNILTVVVAFALYFLGLATYYCES